ncbi:MAG: methyltransferase domain-containing protein [bacterium]|nr:methyltransferase domain-containing protein [bacterium]
MFDDPSQYTTEDKLRARITLHARFSTAELPWYDWMTRLVNLAESESVLEIGCGTGDLWDSMAPPGGTTILLDSSRVMISTAARRTGLPSLVADAASIPLADTCFDVVIANHMLYHLTQPGEGIAEAARLLRESGRFITATNGPGHMQELDKLTGEPPILPGFNLDNGAALLGRHFGTVTLHRFRDGLRVTDPDIALQYLASYRRLSPADLISIRAALAETIERLGHYRVTKSMGAFVCRNPIQ